MRRGPLLLLLLLAARAVPAQDDSTATPIEQDETTVEAAEVLEAFEEEPSGLSYEEWKHVSDDTLTLDRRSFDEASIEHLRADPDLDYDNVGGTEMLWWDRLMRWLGRKLIDLLGSRGGLFVFRHIEWFFLGMLVLGVGLYFRKRLFHTTFGTAGKRVRQVTEVEEDIERLDLDRLLARAEQAQDWRMALRYHYLKVLRRLVDERRIAWEPRYTDQDYLRQLKDPATRATFGELSFLFKWVWYGDAPMDRARYEALRPGFASFHSPAPAAPAARP